MVPMGAFDLTNQCMVPIAVCAAGNQDNPLMKVVQFQGYPILCLDLWEHA